MLLPELLVGLFCNGTGPGTLVPLGTSDAGVELIHVAVLVYKLGSICVGMSLICLLPFFLFAGLVTDVSGPSVGYVVYGLAMLFSWLGFPCTGLLYINPSLLP
jgi:hypothetical protein